MASYILLIPILCSFLITLFLVPLWIKRAKNAGLVGKDIHKINDRKIAESGGVVVMGSFVLGVLLFIAIQTFFYNSNSNISVILALLAVVLITSFIGFIDDILGWKIGLNKKSRMVLVLLSSIPLIVINAGKSDIGLPLLGVFEIGFLYPLVLIPIGIVATTTTFNFLAGMNGLEAGQGAILIGALSIVAYLTGSSWLAIIGLCLIASLLGFLIFNYYPAKIFPGDVLTYGVGAMVAIIAIVGNFEKIAIFFYIPYIIETFLKVKGKLAKQSFAKPLEDGSLELIEGKIYSLNHAVIVLLKKMKIKATEKRVVFGIWVFQILIIVLGFIIFRKGIFGN